MVLCQHGGRSNQKPKRPTHHHHHQHHHNHHHRENTPKAKLGPQRPDPFPSNYYLNSQSLRWETGEPLPRHPRGVQRRWSPEDVLEPPASSRREQVLPTLEGREAPRNTGGVPFSTLRCCVPGPTGSSGSARNSRKGPTQPGPTRVLLTWSEARGGGVASLAHNPREPSRSPLRKRRTSATEAAILR